MIKINFLGVSFVFAMLVCLAGVSVAQASERHDGAKAHKQERKCKDKEHGQCKEHHEKVKARHEEWKNASPERRAEMKEEREAHWNAKSDDEKAHSCKKIHKRCAEHGGKPFCKHSVERCSALAE